VNKSQWKVGILLFDRVDVMDFAGPYEVFTYTAYQKEDLKKFLVGRDTQEDQPFLVSTVSETGQPIRANHGLTFQPDFSFKNAPRFDILVIPGSPLEPLHHALQNRNLLEWISKHMEEVELMTSVCSGAFFLAKAGLLSGKKATTHWGAYDHFERQFPDVEIVKNVKFVDDGKIITSGGVSSGINMALHVVNRLLGSEMAHTTAKAIDFSIQKS